MKKNLIIINCIVLFFMFGCSTLGIKEMSRTDGTSTDFCASSNLQKIRIALDQVKAAPNDEDFESPCTGCREVELVGLSLEQIESCLGPANRNNELFLGEYYSYVFYKFADPGNGGFVLGGGLELFLKFNRDNICISANWWITQ